MLEVFTRNVGTCLKCPRCEQGSGRELLCLESSKPFTGHAQAGDCPLNKFTVGGTFAAKMQPAIPLAGDLIEQAMASFGADRLARWWQQMTGKPCGCKERQEKINRADAALRRWLGRRGVGA